MAFGIPDWLCDEIRRRWLALREKINRNPRIIIGAALASTFVFLMILTAILIPDQKVQVTEYKKAWFYDLNTSELFLARSDLVPPIEAPSGPLPDGRPAGVKAYVFAYGTEPNESDIFIGFLETADPNVEQGVPEDSQFSQNGFQRWGKGRLIRRVDGEKWYPADSRPGRAAVKSVITRRDSKGRQAYYYPPQQDFTFPAER